MNTRVLELIKNPEIFQHTDLVLLDSELKKSPYIQSLRALHLLGTHRFNDGNYQKILSETAAYTTDKKILYQFINRDSEIKKTPKSETVAETKSQQCDYQYIKTPSVETPKPVYINGELNRILFEGEEDFLEKESEIIDLESTIESGNIVIQKPDNEFVYAKKEDSAEVINKNEIPQEKQPEESAPELSFYKTEEFLPEVKIKTTDEKKESYEIPKPVLSKHEEEMQRLIAEVEAKMKNSKKQNTEVQEENHQNTEVNFGETQNFEIAKTEKIISKENQEIAEIEEKPAVLVKKEDKTEQIIQKNPEIEKSEWKPMGIVSNTPDSLLEKKQEEKPLEKEEKTEPAKLSENKTETTEISPINVSFFTPNLLPIETEKSSPESESIENSNVPNFINTWQNWLKIERKEPKIIDNPVISKIEVKNTIIEKFIETEPKISPLKDESSFVIKEKSQDISHLMTETLANLYVEQKLYSKAIKAYKILKEKHPEKEDFFEEKIQEIKKLR